VLVTVGDRYGRCRLSIPADVEKTGGTKELLVSKLAVT